MKTEINDVVRRMARGALFLLACSALLRASGSIRLNAGGGAYTDSTGNVWSADSGFVGGGTFGTSAGISKTSDPALYQTEHYSSSGTLEYTTTLPNGQYSVVLKFAEIYFSGAGQRVFNIVINGATVETNFDPFAAAGGSFVAVDKTYSVNVTGGAIDIRLLAVVQNPKISAIEIDPVTTPTPPSTGPQFADQETPAGTINGANTSYTLAHTPNPAASLILVRNGLVLKQGSDYSLSGNTVVFTSATLPQSGDSLQAFYRY